jgi:acyl-coenzyme A synthetase/AMP-(fatty) acid ligase
MVPEVVIAMPAVVRIGAVHTGEFSASSPESLRDRLVDSEAKALITADGYWRRGKQMALKGQADQALARTAVEKVVVDRRLGGEVPFHKGRDVWYHEIVAGRPFPGIRATYFGDLGPNFYFTKDRARMDEMGNIRITGRVDEVMNVAGHRRATAEVEDALSQHPSCPRSPWSRPDDPKGEVPVAFVLLKKGVQPSEDLKKDLIKSVDRHIGPTARPAAIYFAEDVPKTRAGKIMRQVLKALVRNEPVGDLPTLRNPEGVEELQKIVGYRG